MARTVKEHERKHEPPPAAGTSEAISQRAQARGYHSVEALKREMLKQRPIWWQGHRYHCALCDVDFIDARSAASHVVLQQHPVLRMD